MTNSIGTGTSNGTMSFLFLILRINVLKLEEIRFQSGRNLEVALMIALGESLLGNYAERKIMKKVEIDLSRSGQGLSSFFKAKGREILFF